MSDHDTSRVGRIGRAGVALPAAPTRAAALVKTLALTLAVVAVVAVLVVSFGAGLRGSLSAPAGGGVSSAEGVTLAFAGDLVPHLSLVDPARDPRSGIYDFRPVFEPIAPYLGEADVAGVNLETRLAGPGRRYQGYPLFNSPDELAGGLAAAGVDVVATANNHALDMGFEGLSRTLDVLDTARLGHVGTARTAAEAETSFVLDVRGVRVALLNYTESTNGLSPPAGRPWALEVLSVSSVRDDVARARESGAELVVAVLHWGDEYTRYPVPRQKEMASRLLDAGVDAIVGAHSHVVQPVSWVRSPSGREGLVAWSLGNFVSDQRLRYRDAGVLLYVDAVEDDRGVRVVGARYLPVYVQKAGTADRSRFRVLPVHPDITPARGVGLSDYDRGRMQRVWDETAAHLGGVPGVVPYDPRVESTHQR